MKRYLPVLLPVLLLAVLMVGLLPALSGAASAPVTPFNASQRFVWQQPLPQGNLISAIDFVTDNLGWAIGDNGVVIKTADGGTTWTNQGLLGKQGGDDKTNNLYDVCFLPDGLHGWIGGEGVVYRTVDGGSSWTETGAWAISETSYPSYLSYRSVDFADSNNGWMVADYELFHTTNAGTNVVAQNVPGDVPVTNVDAASNTQALAWGLFTGCLSTSDGGATWTRRLFTGTAHVNDEPDHVAVANGTLAFATVNGDLLKTTDAGSTWTTMTAIGNEIGDYAYMVYLIDGDTTGNTIYVESDGTGHVYKTVNGGATWTPTTSVFRGGEMDVPSSTRLFTVNNSWVEYSDNDAQDFYACRREGGSYYGFAAIDFTSETTGAALRPDALATTTDGGTTWVTRTSTELGIDMTQMVDLCFQPDDPTTAWIVGSTAAPSAPKVYKSTNSGTTWAPLAETTMSAVSHLCFSDANNGWAGDPYPFGVWHSSDGGDSWARMPLDGVVRDIDFVNADTGWIALQPMVGTDLTVMKTTDGGSVWTTQTVGHTGGSWVGQAIDFVDEDNGYAFDSFANMFKTVDGGETWTAVTFWPYGADFRINDVKFSTPLDGWVVGKQQTSTLIPSDRHDWAAHTADGGATWDFYSDAAAADWGSTGTKIGINTLDVFGDDMWFVGGNGSILKTRTRPLATLTSNSATLTAYDQSCLVTGTLTLGGAPVAGRTVELWAGGTTTSFAKSTSTAITGADGSFAFSVKPRSATYYRVRFGGDATYPASAASAYVKVLPAPSVGSVIAPSTMYRTRYYTVYGYLKPKHASGTYPVRIFKDRYVSGTWKSYGYVTAKASNYSTYTKYSRSIKLPYAGRWRLRAYAPTDAGHVAKWSSNYDYVTVR